MILHEIHTNGKIKTSGKGIEVSSNNNLDKCKCSYCHGNNRLHYGLNIPDDWKAWNSWYVIKYWKGRYIRWTNSWLRKIKKDKK